jgi:UDP:flavonoid glycosyltransferase YjiC (YdhE family)
MVVDAQAVRYLWGLDIMGRGQTLVERLPDSYAATYARFGLYLPDDPDWWTFDPSPPSVWPATAGYRRPVRYVPYSPDGEPPRAAYERGVRPRVCLTFGSGIAMKEFVAGAGFAGSPVVQGVLDLDVDVVLAVAAADLADLGPLPARVTPVTSCPLPTLLPRCDAVVHHGGNGTLLTAALGGVPQVVVSYLPETRFSARQFGPTGALRHLEPDGLRREAVREAVGHCLEDTATRSAAAGLRAEMLAQPVPGQLLSLF